MPSMSSERARREAAGLGGELAGVGVVADRRRLETTRARDDEAAGEHLIAGLLVDRIRLAGEQRLVDLERGCRPHDAVGGDLVTGAELDEVVEHDIVHRDLVHLAVAHDTHLWLAEHGELVEGALGAHLLDDADERIAHQHDAEQRVLRMPDREDHHEQHAQDGVEAREDVRPQDLAEGATRSLAAGVGLAPFDALSDLGFGEARRWRLVRPLGRNGLARTRRGGHGGESSRGVARTACDAAARWRRAWGPARSRRCHRPRRRGSRRAGPDDHGRRRGRWR